MTKRIGSQRRKSRRRLIQKKKMKGRIPIRDFVNIINKGDKVVLKANPSFQKGLYHMRFHGRAGEVVSLKGSCCMVRISDGEKLKTLIIHPVHLRKV
jgi:large subunit ribosomal protein L21e